MLVLGFEPEYQIGLATQENGGEIAVNGGLPAARVSRSLHAPCPSAKPPRRVPVAVGSTSIGWCAATGSAAYGASGWRPKVASALEDAPGWPKPPHAYSRDVAKPGLLQAVQYGQGLQNGGNGHYSGLQIH